MPNAGRVVTRIQDQDDAPALGSGQDWGTLLWSDSGGAFVSESLSYYNALRISGIDPTGSANSTTGLQNAVTAAAALGHKSLYLPAGTYKISGTSGVLLALTSNDFRLFGDGVGKTIIKLEDSLTLSGSVTMIRLTGDGQEVFGLTIDGGTGHTLGAHDITGISIYTPATNSFVHLIECYNISGGSAAGGAAISTYDTWNRYSVNTTLGTTIASGAQTVTPPAGGMVGIYIGLRLLIGGTSEEVVVTGRTDTTWTATFANAHDAADTVRAYSFAQQAALVANVYIHDCYKATGVIVNSTGNTFENIRIINVGSATTQHGFYIQGGRNTFSNCWCEGVQGYSYHAYAASGLLEFSGNKFLNCTSIDAKTQHITIQSVYVGVTNPDIGTGNTQRYSLVQGCTFRRTAGAPNCVSGGATAVGPVQWIGNTFEDAGGHNTTMLIPGSDNIVEGNIFRCLNTVGVTSLGVSNSTGTNIVITNNQFLDWSTNGTMVTATGNFVVADNVMKSASGATGVTAILLNGNDVRITGNTIVLGVSGTGLNSFIMAPTGFVFTNNTINSSGARAVNLQASAVPTSGLIADNVFSGTAYFDYTSAEIGLIMRDNIGKIAYRSGLSQAQAGTGKLMAFPKSTNTFTYNRLVKIASGLLEAVGTSDTEFVGITPSTASATAGNVYIVAELGATTYVDTDGAWTAGNYGIVSPTVAGKINDGGGSPPVAGSYVLFLDTGGSAGVATVRLIKTI